MINSITICGRLTKNVEISKTSTGKTKGIFTVAVQQTKQKAIFVPVVVWEKYCEALQTYLLKGVKIVVHGMLDVYNYTNAEGAKRTGFTVVAKDIELCEKKSEQNANDSYYPTDYDEEITGNDYSDIPF